MTDTPTLRDRLNIAAVTAQAMNPGQYDIIAESVSNILLTEIERRCAERGYATLIGLDDHATWGTSITDFIAELRGEVSGG